ncbi:hypothetical protein K1T71_000720 [Dendrolimus kikuchii]|uniref:Uncharacterized protein n=1 Tax=Dendrolimus kikuchii TaxID=765133 RepID=A0ACC1DL18_9NEOP|nr:hypothetical protein K1T71_000720 [Dendrolimus kikuchii]
MGAPTVFIPQLRREANSTDAVSDEMASWLTSIYGYTALPWIIILSILMRYIGRKKTFAIVATNSMVMFVAFYFSLTANQLLISELVQGITHGSTITLSVIVISEYSSPKYRGLFLTIKSATLLWGVWGSNTIGTFFHWKYIPVFGLCCTIYPFVTVYFWPESPQYLAIRGRYSECAVAHRWLKGSSSAAERELKNLIDSQIKLENKKGGINVRNYFNFLSKRECYMPLLLSLLMVGQYILSGKFVFTLYSIEVIKKITNNERTAYIGMLILDGVTVFSMYVGCGLARILKRRILLLISSIIGILFLFVLALYLYLVKLGIIEENKVLSVLFLSCFSLSISLGPMIMATSIYGELVPLRYKSSCVIIIAVSFNVVNATLLKLSPYIFKCFGMHGTFLFYGIAAGVCTFLIYLYLPETKDKTLQEIEEYFKGDTVIEIQLLKSSRDN